MYRQLLVISALAVCAFAQEPAARIPTVSAHGNATVTMRPDQVKIDIGVVTQAQTAQTAASANAKQLTDVVSELKKAAGPGAEIETISYSVSPNYRYPKEGGVPAISGYTATNIVRVTSSDIAGAGRIVDTATKTGANTIHGIQFTLKDEQSARNRALQDAAQQARASAQAMASAVGLRISRIVRMDDSSPVQVQPFRGEMAQLRSAMADASPTPVEPGSIKVQATVVVTAELSQ